MGAIRSLGPVLAVVGLAGSFFLLIKLGGLGGLLFLIAVVGLPVILAAGDALFMKPREGKEDQASRPPEPLPDQEQKEESHDPG